jgi:Fe-S-cluster containining protein
MALRLRVLNMADIADVGEHHAQVPGSVLQARPASLFPCLGCPGHCCHHRVRVTAVEAFRLALTLGFSVDQVARRVPFEPSPPHRLERPPIALRDGEFHLELQRTGEPLRCLFLLQVGGEGRCGAYNLRPALCRLFPYDLEVDGARLQTGDQAWCPTAWLKDAPAEAQLRLALAAQRRDLRQEKALLRAWSRQRGDKDWAAFVAFGVKHLTAYLGVDPRMEQARRPRGRRPLKPALW